MAKSKGAAAAANVDPFAAATRPTAAGGKVSDAPRFAVEDITVYDGTPLTKAILHESILRYAEGKRMVDDGTTMKDTHKPNVLKFARTKFAQVWLTASKRPKNPIIMLDSSGVGQTLKVMFFNNQVVLDENSYASLANSIGAAEAERWSIKRDNFIINPEILTLTTKVKKDGVVVEQNVLQAIKEALMEKFAPSPEILRGMFKVIPEFKTKKGLIDAGPSLVAPDKTPASVNRLAQFLADGGFTTQVREGSGGEAEDGD